MPDEIQCFRRHFRPPQIFGLRIPRRPIRWRDCRQQNRGGTLTANLRSSSLISVYQITGIVSGQNQKLIAINNMPDHLHLLVGLRPDCSLSDLVRDIKAGSSKFISEKRWVAGRFSWQEGFGAFSYSRSQLGDVIRYIQKQQEHHASKTFREEYIELLEKFSVACDQRFIFKTTEA